MQQELKDIVLLIAEDVEINLPQSFENIYYGKMDYSNQNKILDSDSALLKKTIGFEIAFVHVIAYFLARNMGEEKGYIQILSAVDERDKIFSWYRIQNDSIIFQLKKIDINSTEKVYELINEHDRFIDKDVKKKLGQFYTPTKIVEKMVFDVRDELKILSEQDLIVDPACGTGVFAVEILKQMNKFLSFDKLLNFAENNLYAFDVNPFSIVATKLSILNILLKFVSDDEKKKTLVLNLPKLKNIQWKNTIVEKDENKFSIILGNPPYFKLDSKSLKNIEGYESIIYGQPNIYSLFVHWGIEHLKSNGTMSFIVPQSIRSGLYFKKLREEMKELRIKSILHIDSRQNIFDRAEQAVLIIRLQNSPVRNSKTKIQFVNGSQRVLSEFSISRSKLMMNEDNNYMFVINKKAEMYDLFEKVGNNGTTLSATDSLFKFSNGLFVWNQHKDILSDSSEVAIPIIYGGDIQPVKFNFIDSWSNEERKSYAKITDKTKPYVLTGKRLLVQRTTNFEKDIRLKACLISDDFLRKHEEYFLENHVNFLCCNSGKEEIISDEILYYYLGLLNSKLLNYVFISKSGNTQVSANELNLLPYPRKMSKEISEFVSRCSTKLSDHQKELDMLVCEAYELSVDETNLVLGCCGG